MTNAIEQAKREYARAMHDMTHHAKACGPATVERLRSLEDATEEYLELLRQDHEALHETARKRFEDLERAEMLADSFEKTLDLSRQYANQLSARLAKMTEERDSIQLRLHAVDHAYKEQQSKITKAPENAQEAPSKESTDTDSGKDKIAACMGAIERWSDIQASADRGALLDIIKILSGGKD